MSTRSAIVEKTETGEFRGIYCHGNGYLSHNGRILLEHYTNPSKVSELISLGDISTLGSRVSPDENESHSYEKPIKDITVAYFRDRQEDEADVCTTVGSSLEEVLGCIDYSYAYVFINNEWYVYDYEQTLVKLSEIDLVDEE
jgi:hypothetical protein